MTSSELIHDVELLVANRSVRLVSKLSDLVVGAREGDVVGSYVEGHATYLSLSRVVRYPSDAAFDALWQTWHSVLIVSAIATWHVSSSAVLIVGETLELNAILHGGVEGSCLTGHRC